jgi:hypothetical protein
MSQRFGRLGIHKFDEGPRFHEMHEKHGNHKS